MFPGVGECDFDDLARPVHMDLCGEIGGISDPSFADGSYNVASLESGLESAAAAFNLNDYGPTATPQLLGGKLANR